MRLKKMNKTMKCDCKKCNNDAEFYIDTRWLFKNRFCFCEECLKKMFKGFVGTSIPKSIESPFKPNKRITKEKL